MNKILMTIFLILLLIVLGELGFYFFSEKVTNASCDASLRAAPVVPLNNPNTCLVQNTNNKKEIKVHPDNYQELNDWNLSLTKNVELAVTMEGAAQVEPMNGVPGLEQCYLKITLKDDVTGDSFWLPLCPGIEKIAKYYQLKDGKQIPIEYTDFKTGDKLRMYWKVDGTYSYKQRHPLALEFTKL